MKTSFSTPFEVFRPNKKMGHLWRRMVMRYDDGELLDDSEWGMIWDDSSKKGYRKIRNFPRWFRAAMKKGGAK